MESLRPPPSDESRRLDARLLEVFRICPAALAINRWYDATYVDVNAAFSRLLGWTRDEMIGRTTMDLNVVAVDAFEVLRAKLEAEHSVQDLEMTVTVRSGMQRNVLVSCELFEMIKEAPTRLVRSERLIAECTLLNGAVFALDGLTMQFCLFALGVQASFSAAFSAFIVASIVVTLGPIPMGLGSFEAVSIAMLRATGVPFEAALSATLLFRGYTLWVPLVPGMIAARRQLKRRKSDRG